MANINKESRQNAFNFLSLFIYFPLLILTGYLIDKKGIHIKDLNIKELIVITLASYRLTRMVVFEKIFRFFRNFVKSNQHLYVMNTIRFILTCPWCSGVWVTLVIVVFYFLIPYGIYFVYILAVAGVASFIVLAANLTGLKIEERQPERHKKEQ